MGLRKSVLVFLLFGYFLQTCYSKESTKVKASHGGVTVDIPSTKSDQKRDLNDKLDVGIDKKPKRSNPVKTPQVIVVNLSKEKITKLEKTLRKKEFENVQLREDPCKYEPCLHRGLCRNDLSRGPSNYICICPVGYYGSRCQNIVPICGDAPCENGECLSKLDSSLCRCAKNSEDYICNAASTGRHSTIFSRLVHTGHIKYHHKRDISITVGILIALASLIGLFCLIHCFKVWSRRKDLQFFHDESYKDGVFEEPPPPGCTTLCGEVCVETMTGQQPTPEYSKKYGVDMPPLTQKQMNEIVKLLQHNDDQKPDTRTSKPVITKPPKSSPSIDLVKEWTKTLTSTPSKKSLVSSKKSLTPEEIMDSIRIISQGGDKCSSNVASVSHGADKKVSVLLPKETPMYNLEIIAPLSPSPKQNERHHKHHSAAIQERSTDFPKEEYRKTHSASPKRHHEPVTSAMDRRSTDLPKVEYRKSHTSPGRHHESDTSAMKGHSTDLPKVEYRKSNTSPGRHHEPDTSAMDRRLTDSPKVEYRKSQTSPRRHHKPDTSATKGHSTDSPKVEYRKSHTSPRRHHEPDTSATKGHSTYSPKVEYRKSHTSPGRHHEPDTFATKGHSIDSPKVEYRKSHTSPGRHHEPDTSATKGHSTYSPKVEYRKSHTSPGRHHEPDTSAMKGHSTDSPKVEYRKSHTSPGRHHEPDTSAMKGHSTDSPKVDYRKSHTSPGRHHEPDTSAMKGHSTDSPKVDYRKSHTSPRRHHEPDTSATKGHSTDSPKVDYRKSHTSPGRHHEPDTSAMKGHSTDSPKVGYRKSHTSPDTSSIQKRSALESSSSEKSHVGSINPSSGTSALTGSSTEVSEVSSMNPSHNASRMSALDSMSTEISRTASINPSYIESGMSAISGVSRVSGVSAMSGMSAVSGMSALESMNTEISGTASINPSFIESGISGISAMPGMSALESKNTEISGTASINPSFIASGLSAVSDVSAVSGMSALGSMNTEISGTASINPSFIESGMSAISGMSGFSGISAMSGMSALESRNTGISRPASINPSFIESGKSGVSAVSGISAMSGMSALESMNTEISRRASINPSFIGSGLSDVPGMSGMSALESRNTEISRTASINPSFIESGMSAMSGMSGMSALESRNTEISRSASINPSFIGSGMSGISGISAMSGMSGMSALESRNTEISRSASINPSFIESGMSAISGVSAMSGMSALESRNTEISRSASINPSFIESGMSAMSGMSGMSALESRNTEISGTASINPSFIESGMSAISGVSGMSGMSALESRNTEISRTASINPSFIESGMSGISGVSTMSGVSSIQRSSAGIRTSSGSTEKYGSSLPSKNNGKRNGRNFKSGTSTTISEIAEVDRRRSHARDTSAGISKVGNEKRLSSSSKRLRTKVDKNQKRASTTERGVGVRRLSKHEMVGNSSSSASTLIEEIKPRGSRDVNTAKLPKNISTKVTSKITPGSVDKHFDSFHTKPAKKSTEDKIRMKAASPVKVNVASATLSKTKHGDVYHDHVSSDKSKMSLKAVSGSTLSRFLDNRRSSASSVEYKGASLKETKAGNRPRKGSTENDEGGLDGRIRLAPSPMYPKKTFKQIRTRIKPVSSNVYEDWTYSEITSTPIDIINPSPEKYQQYFDNKAIRRPEIGLNRSTNYQDQHISTSAKRGEIRVSQRKSSRHKKRKKYSVDSNITNNSILSVSPSMSDVNIDPNSSHTIYDKIDFRRESGDFEAQISSDSEDEEGHYGDEFADNLGRKHKFLQAESNETAAMKAEETFPQEDENHEPQPCSPQKHEISDHLTLDDWLVPNLSIDSEDRSTPELESRQTLREQNHSNSTSVDVHMPKELVDLETSFENTFDIIPEETTALENSLKVSILVEETLNTSWLVPKSPIVHVETENLPETNANMISEKYLSKTKDVKDISVTQEDLRNALAQTVENLSQDDPEDEREGKDRTECDKAEHVDDDFNADIAQGTSNGDTKDEVDLNESLEWPDIEDTDDKQDDSVNATFGSITMEINELSCELENVEDQEITFRI